MRAFLVGTVADDDFAAVAVPQQLLLLTLLHPSFRTFCSWLQIAESVAGIRGQGGGGRGGIG